MGRLRPACWKVVPEPGPVAQVAHPVSARWLPRDALAVLAEVAAQVPSTVKVLVTGGGFIQLQYPRVNADDCELRQPTFLSRLHTWVSTELMGMAQLVKSSRCELIIGVDVDVNNRGVGQFRCLSR